MNDRHDQPSLSQSGGVLSPYVHSLASHGRLSTEEQADLARAWRERGCEASRERLITSNLRLVIACARKYAGRGVPMDELVAEGNVGLVQAVDRFDPDAGCRLSTYAAYWIKQSIARAFASVGRSGQIGRRDRAQLSAFMRASNALFIANGQEPSLAELAAELGWTVERTARIMELRKFQFARESISEKSEEFGASNRAPELPTELTSDGPQRSLELERALATLSRDERTAVEVYFGLNGGEGRSLRAVAQAIGRPPKATRTLLRVAISKLGRARIASPEDAADKRERVAA